MLVVLHHASVPHITGGYVGADVFLIISGFVITSLLFAGADQYWWNVDSRLLRPQGASNPPRRTSQILTKVGQFSGSRSVVPLPGAKVRARRGIDRDIMPLRSCSSSRHATCAV